MNSDWGGRRREELLEYVYRRGALLRMRRKILLWGANAVVVGSVVLVGGLWIPRLVSAPERVTTSVPDRKPEAIIEVSRALSELPAGWSELPRPPFLTTEASAIWAQTSLFVFGGSPGSPGEAALFDPAAGSWRNTRRSPIEGRANPAVAWTGTDILVWGGSGPRGDGAAYRPQTGLWRKLPDAPIAPRIPVGAVWSGDEMIVWGGHAGRSRTFVDGAAYDPAANRWRKIADAPVEINLGSMVWTGEEMIVIGARLDNNNVSSTKNAVGAAYSPATNRWRRLPEFQLSPQASTAAWTGNTVVVWDYELTAGAYDPRTDRWRELPRLPLDFSECYPSTAAGERFLLANYCGQHSLLDLSTLGWLKVDPPSFEVFGRPVAAGPAFLFAGAADETTDSRLAAFKPIGKEVEYSGGPIDGEPCTAPNATSSPRSDNEGCLMQASGDFDGDGINEFFQVFAKVDSDNLPTEWFARVRFSSGGQATLEALVDPALGRLIYPRIIGIADVNRDGREETFLSLDRGASVEFLGLFTIIDKRIVRVLQDGEPARLSLGGTVTSGSGIECRNITGGRGPVLNLIGVFTEDGGSSYRWQEESYRLEGANLRRVGGDAGTLGPAAEEDPEFRRFYEFGC